MARNASVSRGDHFAGIIDAQVGDGRYGSASDVVRAGPRLLEVQEAKRDALRSALSEGEASGSAEAFDLDGFLRSRRGAR